MLFSHHVNEFDTSQSNVGSGFGLEAEHRSDSTFDTAMILLNGVVHILAGSHQDGITGQFQSIFCIALQDSNAVGLTAINGDPLWSAMAS